jgi:hypothetical protein
MGWGWWERLRGPRGIVLLSLGQRGGNSSWIDLGLVFDLGEMGGCLGL